MTELSKYNIGDIKTTDDIDWFCDAVDRALQNDINNLLDVAVATGQAVYYDSETSTTDSKPVTLKNRNNQTVNTSITNNVAAVKKKYYYKVKQSTTKNDVLTAIGVKNIHDNILRDYMYVEDDSADLTGIIEWMKMITEIKLLRQENISIELCVCNEVAKKYNTQSDTLSIYQSEYLYGTDKLKHEDVICFNSLEEVYDDFERLNTENEKNGRAFEDALIFHLSDEKNGAERIELLEYE
jgi:hypothetical protein